VEGKNDNWGKEILQHANVDKNYSLKCRGTDLHCSKVARGNGSTVARV
jgi:hypothetical protein